MDNFNKVVSFVLGLVVVIVFFAVITGKLNLGKFTPSFAKKTTISPTPKTTSTVVIEENTSNNTNTKTTTYKVNNYLTNTKSIPATGLPTFFIPSVFASGLAGFFLRKTGKK